MRLLLLGPPGSGKGTQAQLLAARQGAVHISTGDMLRAAQAAGTPLGLQAKKYMDAGKLVPDDLVSDTVAEKFRCERPATFLMDGYPRTIVQAEAFDTLLAELKLPLEAAVLIDVPDEEIAHRITGRLTCSNCKATFHKTNRPPKVEGRCDVCGHSPLIQRPDDTLAVIEQRLKTYHSQTAELVGYYRARGLLRTVDGKGDVEAIYRQIVSALG